MHIYLEVYVLAYTIIYKKSRVSLVKNKPSISFEKFVVFTA